MAASRMVASGIAQHTRQRLEHIVGRFKQVPNRVWRRGCLAVLVLWLCYSLAQLFWLVVPTPQIPTPPLSLSNSALFAESSERSTSQVDIEELKGLALFGEGASDEQVVVRASGIEQEAVDTSLQITLHGAVPSSNPDRAKAIIGDGRRQVSFNAGEELSVGPRGVRLAKVLPDRVILDNNGRYETLWLYSTQNGGASASSAAPPPRSSSVAANGPRRPARTRGEVGVANGDELLQTDQQQMPTDDQVRMVTDVLNVSMHREGGQLIGFRIRPKGDRELFDELGLQPNDIVTAVNNIGLDDTSRAMEVYRSLGQESRATLEILRDGTTITVDVALDQ